MPNTMPIASVPRPGQLLEQRAHEGEHHELPGHLQHGDRKQQQNRPVAADRAPGLQVHRRALQSGRQAQQQQQEADAAERADPAIGRSPAVAAGHEGDQRQADGGRQRPAEKDIGNRAAAPLRRHDQRRRAGRLRRIERADREHHQADDEEARIVGRERRGEIAEGEHRQRGRKQRPPFDAAREPGRQRRADAQRDRAEGDQEPGRVDADAEPRRQFRQHPRRRQHRTAGDEIAEHEGGWRETAGGGGFLHATACRAGLPPVKGRCPK
ncbi:hypothetical protein ACVI1J_000664 [Bradyrhizobium diazoefficiens]